MSKTNPKLSHVAITIAFNSFIAISTTLANKHALRTLALPLTLLWSQAIVAFIVLAAVSRLFPTQDMTLMKPVKIWRTFMPLGLTRILGALSKTACLANVDAAFYQTARGLLLPFTAILSLYFLPNTRFPPLTLLGIVFVVLGFIGGIWVDLVQSLSLNWGIALGIWSSFTTAVETVVLKHYSGGNDLHMLQLIFMSAALSSVVYAPLVFVFESSAWSLASTLKHQEFATNALISAVVALTLAFSTWMQVKLTSPVTHTVVAATRGVLQSLMASISFHEALPLHRWLSTIFILGGTAVYTWSNSVQASNMEDAAVGEYSKLPDGPDDGPHEENSSLQMSELQMNRTNRTDLEANNERGR